MTNMTREYHGSASWREDAPYGHTHTHTLTPPDSEGCPHICFISLHYFLQNYPHLVSPPHSVGDLYFQQNYISCTFINLSRINFGNIVIVLMIHY